VDDSQENFQISPKKKKRIHIKYSLNIKYGKISYSIEKRFSDFYKLYKTLFEIFKNFEVEAADDREYRQLEQDFLKIAGKFPAKTIFNQLSNKKFLNHRQAQLNEYLEFLNKFFAEITINYFEIIQENNEASNEGQAEDAIDDPDTGPERLNNDDNSDLARQRNASADQSSCSFDLCQTDQNNEAMSSFDSLDEDDAPHHDQNDQNENHQIIISTNRNNQTISNFYKNIFKNSNNSKNYRSRLKLVSIFSNFFSFINVK